MNDKTILICGAAAHSLGQVQREVARLQESVLLDAEEHSKTAQALLDLARAVKSGDHRVALEQAEVRLREVGLM